MAMATNNNTDHAGREQVQDGNYVVKLEKIQWYREVLELEPGSKVFLPFARLLAEVGRYDEAASILLGGLERHPEFTEARLFLIDILHKTGNEQRCRAEVARLAGMFCKYPEFWDAWSDFSVAQGAKKDLSISLSFLGALFKNDDLTLLDVLAAGLGKPHSGTLSPSGGLSVQLNPAELITDETSQGMDFQPEFPSDFSGVDDTGFATSELSQASAAISASFSQQPASSLASERHAAKKFSLRTRSMAEVLAEQGDLRGAIEIYEELLAKGNLDNRAEIEAEVENLRARLGEEGNQPVQLASASSTPKNIALPQRNGMLDLLEKLAVRLETKARQ